MHAGTGSRQKERRQQVLRLLPVLLIGAEVLPGETMPGGWRTAPAISCGAVTGSLGAEPPACGCGGADRRRAATGGLPPAGRGRCRPGAGASPCRGPLWLWRFVALSSHAALVTSRFRP